MKQVYFDVLKDENTRGLEIAQRKKLLFYLFLLFQEHAFRGPMVNFIKYLHLEEISGDEEFTGIPPDEGEHVRDACPRKGKPGPPTAVLRDA